MLEMKRELLSVGMACIMLMLYTSCARKASPTSGAPAQITPKPAWVQQRPVEPGQYIGIGVARKNPYNPADHLEAARKQALSDIAMQIKVRVDANSTQSQVENNQSFSEEFRSFTRTMAQAELEECQLVDTWQNEQEYWVFYRLSQEEYRMARARKIQLAVDQALVHFQSARQSARRAEVVAAYDFCLRALDRLAPFSGERLVYEEAGVSRSLLGDVAELMVMIARETRIEFGVQQWRVKIAHAPEDLEIRVRFLGAGEKDVAGFPLKIRYQGIESHSGWKLNTDQDGRIRLRTGVIPTTANRLISLKAEMNLEALSLDAPHWRWLSLLPPAQRPAAELPIEILPATVEMKISANGDLSGWSTSATENTISTRLAKAGVVVFGGTGRPDFQLALQLDCRAFSAGVAQSSAVINGTLQITDSAKVVRYQQSLNEVRSTGPDSPAALRAAQKRLLENLELSVLPGVLERILQSNSE